jgi:hypothetical protein
MNLSETGKRNVAVKMTKQGVPDSMIVEALGITAGFLAKAQHDAGLITLTKAEINKVQRLASLGLSDRQIAKHMNLKYEDSPAITAAKADVASKARDLCKSVKLTLAKGRKSSPPGAIIANVIRKQAAEGSSYEAIHHLLNPDGDADGISLYAVKAVVEYGESLV